MHSFKEMDQEEIRAILDAKDEHGELLYRDILTPLATHDAELFARASCPKCGSRTVAATIDTRRPFTPASPLPNRLARCVVCQTEFDPRSGLITLANIIDG